MNLGFSAAAGYRPLKDCTPKYFAILLMINRMHRDLGHLTHGTDLYVNRGSIVCRMGKRKKSTQDCKARLRRTRPVPSPDVHPVGSRRRNRTVAPPHGTLGGAFSRLKDATQPELRHCQAPWWAPPSCVTETHSPFSGDSSPSPFLRLCSKSPEGEAICNCT